MAFLRNLLATIVGLLVFSILCIVFFFGFVALVSRPSKPVVAANSVLYMNLDQPILEQSREDPLAELELFPNQHSYLGLINIKKAISKAKTDEKISGIFLNVSHVMAGSSTKKAIRDALLDFKESGKFVIAYSSAMSEGAYYLNSAADQIFCAPEGGVEFNGLKAEIAFFKGLFDKLGIEPEVFRVGKFKSAIEPFILTEMSEANRLQTSSFLESLNEIYLKEIAASRKKKYEEIKDISDNMLIRSIGDGVNLGMLDGAKYYDEVLDILKEKTGTEEGKKLKSISLQDYISAVSGNKKRKKDRIAVIVAQGEIVQGKSRDGKIGDKSLAQLLRKVRDNDKIKAVVLRVNSPGGSALASDNIWREVQRVKEKKPIIASMSDLAASGGYYISMGCDTIVAQPNTLTGSIGIFGLMFNPHKFLSEKIGITASTVKTGEYSDLGNPFRKMTQSERNIIQKQVEHGYETFTSKAAAGRHLALDRLLEVAEGRVWTGEQAQKIGLVDVLGNMDDALRIAAEKASLEEGNYSLTVYPKPKSVFEELMSNYSQGLESRILGDKFKDYMPLIHKLEEAKSYEGINARLPYKLVIE
ncbi:MAG: signal peptide peptidase SppA [Cytophagales bacterium]|nr:signal peptide peptidase SppA [Cytophagales bacterium]